MIGRPRIELSSLDPQRVEVLHECLFEESGELLPAQPLLLHSSNYPVLDVGYVLHLRDSVALELQKAPQEILEEESPEVSYMGVIPDRRAASVHPHLLVSQGSEGEELPPVTVVEP